ncbi:MAG: motility protein A [Candidatus Electryonea clarkiae]|nr:motility protein A [Candidatus Electryonea clarkiae]MDP8287308.1 motility protein A [Candidatus Electryonea clarkiae]
MDIATLVGIFAAGALILLSILIGEGASFFFNLPSFMIVFGGAFGATLVNFPLADVLEVVNVAKNAFLHKTQSHVDTIELLVRIAEKARREGILAIEREVEGLDDKFMRIGVQYAVDGTEPETIRAILESELSGMEDRHRLGKKVFEALGTYAPAFGMIGTLIGLIKMLAALEDPSQIGAGMAVALVTTLYGALAANLIFLPIAGKLEERSHEEAKRKELVIEGILSIQSGDNPRIVREKLLTFLPPKDRLEEDEDAGGLD